MLHVHRWVVVTLFVVSVLLLLQGTARAASCTPDPGACDGTTGTVGTDSCNGGFCLHCQ